MSPTAFVPGTPYWDLPDLPPKAELETAAVLKACIRARAALAELKVAAELIPNATVLINTIPMLEAVDSSAIENIVTTADALFRLGTDATEASDPIEKEALRYRTALRMGHDLARERPVSTNLATTVCTELRGIKTAVRKIPGTALTNLATGETVYTPPDGEARLRRLLANWERFLHGDDQLDPLIRMAVGHYQFEAIHPFEDGNGRTGRILNLLFLVEQTLLPEPILYMSRAILRSKSTYYRRLLEVTTKNAWEPWLLYMLDIVNETARWTTEKIRAIRQQLTQASSYIRDHAPKVYSHELVDIIFNQPYCRIENLVGAGVAKRQTAARYLAALVDIGVLEAIHAGREKLFIHRALLQLLTSDTHETPPYTPPARAPELRSTELDDVLDESGVNDTSLDEQLRFAIGNRRLLGLVYSGSLRLVEPHDYGVHKGVTRLLAYQHKGPSRSGRPSLSGWRLFDVAKITQAIVLRQTFAGSRGDAHERHYEWDPLYARVR